MATFTHIDSSSRPTMVDVSDKVVTKRTATASDARALSCGGRRGVALTAVQYAEGARVSDGHHRGHDGGEADARFDSVLSSARHREVQSVSIEMEGDEAVVLCTVSVHHKTGVEMEALTGASVAALTIYDMCKALSHDIVIAETRLVEKRGGKSDVG